MFVVYTFAPVLLYGVMKRNDFHFVEPIEIEPPKSPKANWTKKYTGFLLSFVLENKGNIYDLSINRKKELKQHIWDKAANDPRLDKKFSSEQCSNKWKNLKSKCKVNCFFSFKIKF